MTLQNKLRKLHTELSKLDIDVYHYRRTDIKPPYVVWAEDSESNALNADSIKSEQVMHGTIDCYTQKEFDENLDKIQDILTTVCGASWRLNFAGYEEELNTIHYEWEFEV